MILKILLNLFFVSYLLVPVESTDQAMVATLDDANQVSYQVTSHYLPEIGNKYKLPAKLGDSLGIKVSADSVIIIDANSGQVLWQKNPGRSHPIASLTKLMTAYTFLGENYDLDKVVEISLTQKEDPEESTLNVSRGEQITVYDLFYSALVGSANNATRELATSLGYTESQFTALMNEKAQGLGLTETNFVDVTGISKGNVSTASDYIKLVRLALNKELIQDATTKLEHRFTTVSGSGHNIKNSNKLLERDLNIIAGKTGFINEAGYCLALKVEDDEGNAIIILSLGSDSSSARFAEVKSLAQWTFLNYQWD
ncbi:MAG: serine hydrolase [Patescibacteria group bacterium]